MEDFAKTAEINCFQTTEGECGREYAIDFNLRRIHGRLINIKTKALQLFETIYLIARD